MNLIRQALGALTPEQIDQSNAVLYDLSMTLARQSQVINQAQEAGYDRQVIAQAKQAHARLLTQLEMLSVEAPALDSAAFAEWLSRVQGLSEQVSVYQETTGAQLEAASGKRTLRIVLATVGALAAAGAIAGLVWYVTQPGAVLARKGVRKRRRAARRRR